jgi:hypothetical protein
VLAKIYRPAKTAMQSGRAGAKQWVLEFEPEHALAPERLMGWTSSADPDGQVRLYFDTREQAIAFARRNGLPHQAFEPAEPKRVIKAYGDNFAYRRKEPWSH